MWSSETVLKLSRFLTKNVSLSEFVLTRHGRSKSQFRRDQMLWADQQFLVRLLQGKTNSPRLLDRVFELQYCVFCGPIQDLSIPSYFNFPFKLSNEDPLVRNLRSLNYINIFRT